jgi:IS605 OrfB family transposase
LTKYPAWRRKGILNRIRSYHREAGNILEDWVRKASLEIGRLAKELGYAVDREDLTGLIDSLRRIENNDHRTRLIIMGYKRLGKWIDWQAEKRGVPPCENRSQGGIIKVPHMRFQGIGGGWL